mmetsp:Transcript_16319/g.37658  ORF Transcript_16319/g.37658 Transcript_16319/m.37658 type:complete len:161 (-) Transcript_16319:85-567(-)
MWSVSSLPGASSKARLGIRTAQTSGLCSPFALSQRWRSQHEGGRYGPNYNRFPTEVKVTHPARDRSRLWKFPDSKRLTYVTTGWYYPPNVKKIEENRIYTAVLSVVRPHSHAIIDSFTYDEMKELEKFLPTLEKQFQECESELVQNNEEATLARQAHVSR